VNTSPNPPPPIVSLSLNPAIDLTYEITALEHDRKTRAYACHYDPGGTGVNVGRALEKLNANAHTCLITAGKMGEFLESLLSHELKHFYALKVNGETRINTTISQQKPKHQYEVNAAGAKISTAQLEEISNYFLTTCQQGIGILTGSLPPETPTSTYQIITRKLQAQGGRAIIDAPVAILGNTLSCHPFLVKPNLHELEELQNKKLTSIEQIASEARRLTQQGPRNVCVSLGDKGAILTCQENSYYCRSPRIQMRSTVGAGDSMVAGLAYAFSQEQTPQQALKLAVACGAGTAKYPGTQLFTSEDIHDLSEQINIEILDI